MSIRKSKARKLAEFLRNITAEAKLTTEAVQDDKVVTTGADLDSKSADSTALVSAASVTSYVGDKLDDYVHSTHDINLTFTGDVTGHGTITDMSHTSFALTLDAETLPVQTGYAGKFLTTDGTTASWATVDTSNGDTAYSWGDHSQAGYLTSETNDYVDSVSFSTSTGILRLGRTGSLSDLTVDLDGRYLQSFTESDTLQSVTARGASTDQNILIEKNNPVLTLSDTNANPSTYPTINFTTTNNQGVNLYYTEFDSELPLSGYGLVLDADSANTQFSGNVGAISLNVLGEVYAGSRELGTLHKVWHAGNLDPNNYLLTSNYVDTTYSVSAVDVSGGKAVRLTGSDGTTDDVKFAAGGNVSLARSGDTITISSTDTNTETTTNLVDNGDNTITYTNEEGTAQTIDLSLYLDDTNLARILSGTMNSSGVATFTRDDDTTFTVDMSVLLDDTNLSRITSASWNTSNGVLTLTRNDNTTVAVDLDGRYVQKNADIVVANAGPKITLTDTTDSDDHRIAFSNSSTELHSINTIGSRLNIDSGQDIKVNRNGTKILDIVSSGLNVTGAVNATSFSGSLDYNDITNPPVIDNSVDYINGASFDTATGVLTLSGVGRAGATVDLDGRYYNTTDSNNRYVLKTGDTMSGDLVLSSSSIRLPNSSSDGIRSSDNYRVVDSLGDTLRIGDTAKHNIIRMHGNGSDDFRVYYNSTDYKIWHEGNFNPNSYSTTSVSDGRYVKKASLGLIGNSNVAFGSTAGWPNNPTAGFYKTDYVGYSGLVIMSGDVGGSTSSIGLEFAYNGQIFMHSNTDSNQWHSHKLFTDAYHPNADKWTTARSHTVTLTGDVTGSATQSVDGSGNKTWSINTVVANNSHTHDDRYVRKTGDTMTGVLTFSRSATRQIVNLNGTPGAHSLGWESYNNTYGPDTWNGGFIGHKFYANSGTLIASIGAGGSTSTGGTYSTFYGHLRLNDGNTRIQEGGGNSVKVQTNSGYIELGPMNTGHCHLQTDRSNFYFNKEVVVDTGLIGSYNEDLQLRRARNSAHQIRIAAGTTTISQNTVIQGNLTVSGSISQSDGFGTLYTFNTTQALSTSWANVSAIAGSTLPTGTYAIQIKVYNSDAGGGNYDEHYSGTMAWYGSGTNDNDSNEIPLHNAGHAYNGAAIYARTLRRYASAEGNMILQLAASGSISSDAIEIKIRRLI